MTALRVVRGTPDDDELAAVVAALSIVSARRARGSRGSRPFAIPAWRTAFGNGGGRANSRIGPWRALGGSER